MPHFPSQRIASGTGRAPARMPHLHIVAPASAPTSLDVFIGVITMKTKEFLYCVKAVGSTAPGGHAASAGPAALSVQVERHVRT